MIDGTGRPQSLLLLGGASDIAVAVAEEYARHGTLRVEVAARPSPKRERAVSRLEALGLDVVVSDFDARDVQEHPRLIESVASRGDIDIALVAFGILGDEERAWQDHGAAVALAEVNFVAAVSVGVCLAQVMRRQGHGVIVALSSVAGERVRRSNFVYGATKAGMDGFYLGLGEALSDSGVSVTVVRPGFVTTAMTAGRPRSPLSVSAAELAQAVVVAVTARKPLVWVPGSLRAVMSGLRHVPRPVFRRLPL